MCSASTNVLVRFPDVVVDVFVDIGFDALVGVGGVGSGSDGGGGGGSGGVGNSGCYHQCSGNISWYPQAWYSLYDPEALFKVFNYQY